MAESSKGQTVGYARVSTTDQNLDRQVAALGDVDRLFSEKVSAKSKERPQLQEALAYVREGDTLLVKSADRLARSTTDLLSIVQELRAKGVRVKFVDSPELDTDTPQGEFTLTILGAVAQLERSLIRERQAEGIAIARAKGTYKGRPGLSPEQIEEAREKIALGVPKAVIAADMGFARSTLYDALAGRGRYAKAETETEETNHSAQGETP